jgi:hypothetical protein
MSHFPVLVVGQDVEQQLAPFQENNMGDCPREYMEFTDHEDDYRHDYDNEGAEMVVWFSRGTRCSASPGFSGKVKLPRIWNVAR